VNVKVVARCCCDVAREGVVLLVSCRFKVVVAAWCE